MLLRGECTPHLPLSQRGEFIVWCESCFIHSPHPETHTDILHPSTPLYTLPNPTCIHRSLLCIHAVHLHHIRTYLIFNCESAYHYLSPYVCIYLSRFLLRTVSWLKKNDKKKKNVIPGGNTCLIFTFLTHHSKTH